MSLRLRNLQLTRLRLVPAGNRASSALLVDLLGGSPCRQKVQGQVFLLLLRSDKVVAQQSHGIIADFLKSRNLLIRQCPAPGLGDVEGIPGISVEGVTTHALASSDVVHPGLEVRQEFQSHIFIHLGSLASGVPDQVLIAYEHVALPQGFGQGLHSLIDLQLALADDLHHRVRLILLLEFLPMLPQHSAAVKPEFPSGAFSRTEHRPGVPYQVHNVQIEGGVSQQWVEHLQVEEAYLLEHHVTVGATGLLYHLKRLLTAQKLAVSLGDDHIPGEDVAGGRGAQGPAVLPLEEAGLSSRTGFHVGIKDTHVTQKYSTDQVPHCHLQPPGGAVCEGHPDVPGGLHQVEDIRVLCKKLSHKRRARAPGRQDQHMHGLGLLLRGQGVEFVAIQMEQQGKDGHLGNQKQQWPHFFGRYHHGEVEEL